MNDFDTLYQKAVQALAEYVEAAIRDCAKDNGEDVRTYCTDTDVVSLYAGDLLSKVSEIVTSKVQQ